MSLKRFMLAISLAVCAIAMAASGWRAATQPDISFEVVLEFSGKYSPPALNSRDIAETMYQMTPDRQVSDRTAIDKTLANARTKVMPYGENAVQVVVSGKSWQIELARVELIARATAQLISNYAADDDVSANITRESSSRGQSPVPQRILAEYDRTRQ